MRSPERERRDEHEKPTSARCSGVVPRTRGGTTSSERDAVDAAVEHLLRGHLDGSPARLRLAKLKADARGDTELAVLARFALALEEAMRGDLVAAEAYLTDGAARASTYESTLELEPSFRSVVAAWRAHALLARGERARATDVWLEALAGVIHLDPDAPMARAVRALDPRAAFLVGPNVSWLETPDGTRIDLARSSLSRDIFAVLLERQVTAVPPTALCRALWPDLDSSSPGVRNRMKVAMWRLRDLGLRAIVRRCGMGYRLSAEHRYVRWQSGPRDDSDCPAR